MVREGKSTGKSIEHLHYHIIPDITLGAGDHSGADRMVLNQEEINNLINRLKSAI